MTDLDATPLTAAAAALPTRYPAHVGAVRLFGHEFHRDAAGVFRRLRAQHGSVAPALLDGDIPVWIALGYRDVHHVLTKPDLFDRDSSRWNAMDLVPPDWPQLWLLGGNDSVVTAGGEEHAARSAVVHDALAGVDGLELRARCERIADQLIDEFARFGEAELMSQFVLRLPGMALAGLLGIPFREVPGMVRDLATTMEHVEGSLEAHARMTGGLRRLVRERLDAPTFDLTSRMVHHPLAPTEDRLVEDLSIVLLGGGQPTAHWIGNTLRLLLSDARFATRLAGGRRSVGQAMGEVLWEDPPVEILSVRFAVRVTQLGTWRIQPGDLVMLGIAASNADPQIRPDLSAGAGGNQAHLSFGHGPHRCPFPAQELAEVIAETAIEVLLDRLPDLTLAVPADKLRWRESVWIRGLSELPVVFTPA
ncbi:cytochrome P450 [Frankia sp. CNm7]|uniref:Cytochrome P450 n=1 Tax=Frankia nepalensis TaxID=1836974 RepID=A0A937RKE8_9ACTN|nr:cytochrome P450 [Frankia nepalensis]MBL7500057.1 cytochrome P450 [Frankia nepalensis]MBL7509409.1 cytochrome P450 [Frankia nepalensis]MBL7519349.1 cytochrome P450 [Frankia nepalensis]MBL7631902.1 cytochrome P450 [Frankia nepalensis]